VRERAEYLRACRREGEGGERVEDQKRKWLLPSREGEHKIDWYAAGFV